MGKTSYQNIGDLIKELDKNLAELRNASLGISQLEPMLENSKELYERLIVLRFKAYEKYGDPEKEEIKNKKEEVTAFDFTNMNQEEEVQEEEVKSKEVDFPELKSEALVEVPEESNEEATNIEPEEGEEEVLKPEIEEKAKVENQNEEQDAQVGFDFGASLENEVIEESLHEKLKIEEDEVSLRKKLQASPISDIKSEISLARRFEYISILFNEDAEAYDAAIIEFNNCSDAKEARLKLDEYSSKYVWNLENKAIVKFVELVERRYL